jgi:N-acyl-D-amino-acid deacylase
MSLAKRPNVSVLLICLLTAPIFVVGVSAIRSREQTLDTMITAFLEEHEVPGAVVAVGIAGTPPQLHAYGLADVLTGRPMRDDLRFRIASLSKPITALTVLALVRESRLALSDKLVDIVPEAQAAHDRGYRDITVLNLLQHSGGWDAAKTFDPFFLEEQQAQEKLNLPRAERCRPLAFAMLSHPLQFNPGERYAYSNLGYCWLEMIIEKVYEGSYQQAAQELILKGATAESMQIGEDEPEGGRVRHHTEKSEADLRQPFLQLKVLSAAGGWTATAEEYFRFASLPIDAIISSRPHYASGSNFYGLGWRVWPAVSGDRLSHFGSMPGSFSFVMRDEKGHILVAFFNARPRDDLKAFEALKAAFENTFMR